MKKLFLIASGLMLNFDYAQSATEEVGFLRSAIVKEINALGLATVSYILTGICFRILVSIPFMRNRMLIKSSKA